MRRIGDNHDPWTEIRFEETPLSEETDVGAQGADTQSTGTQSGDGEPRGICSGPGSSSDE